MAQFCDIASRNELADFLGIPRQRMTYVLYVKKVESYYTSFEIPKKNGETRTIKAPTGELKFIQKKLVSKLVQYQREIWRSKGMKPNISHGFEKGKSIVTNAKIHKNKRYLLNIDLQDFFDSFHFGRVRGFFEKNRDFALPLEVATVLAQLTLSLIHILPQQNILRANRGWVERSKRPRPSGSAQTSQGAGSVRPFWKKYSTERGMRAGKLTSTPGRLGWKGMRQMPKPGCRFSGEGVS